MKQIFGEWHQYHDGDADGQRIVLVSGMEVVGVVALHFRHYDHRNQIMQVIRRRIKGLVGG